ncbi:VOC family protein [Streptomyces sp. YIM 98790]|uniref:VOC family protein n=1 Tax=Streptomyces sp. YIM 98790 TaxID=2689077 RepID=UPI00140A6360|nr:VOC family protein [Streptomyces sp. YIM 98790]
MITTDFVTGSPSWIDLGAPDVRSAAAFYRAVFGWEYQPFGEEADGYGAFVQDGRTVAAVGKLTEEGARPAWMIYFHSPDVEATTRAVQEAGGTVRVPPMDAEGWARLAQFTDPQGGQFAAWEPVKSGGLEAVDQPGTLCWIELMTTDAGAAKQFYRRLFGFEYTDVPLPGGMEGSYGLVATEGGGEERQLGGVMEMPADALSWAGGPYWHPVFAVEDCDAAAARVTGNGGTLQMGPEDMEGVGRTAVCVDPSGADFVLLQPAPPS